MADTKRSDQSQPRSPKPGLMGGPENHDPAEPGDDPIETPPVPAPPTP